MTILQTNPPRDMSPFPTGYSKLKRFSKILDGVLYPTPATADGKMLKHISLRKYDSLDELRIAMKSADLRDKRYTSIHLFAKLFVTSYKAPPVRNYDLVRRAILRAFEDVQFSHLRVCPTEQFFNYNYLLVVLLKENGLGDLVQYVKNLRCKRRRAFYKTQLLRLRAVDRFKSAYNARPNQVGVSETRKPPSELWDGRPKPRFPIQSPTALGETLLRKYMFDRIGETQCYSAG